MWPFKKTYPELTEIDSIKDVWSVASREHGGAPLIVRKNTGCAAWVGHPELTIKLGFAIPLSKQNPGGLPDPGENQELNAIEDRIVERVASVTRAVFVLTLTTGTMKELVFYVADGSVVESLHLGLKESIKSHDVQCVAGVERDWETYRQF